MQKSVKTYCFDLDETLCHYKNKEYDKAKPVKEMIDRLNYLYNNGNKIIIFTNRGMDKFNSDIKKIKNKYEKLTIKQLNKWSVNYHELIFGKPLYDTIIDNKCLSILDFKKIVKPKVGFICGSFDIIHPGYVHMFKEIKKHCNILIVGLHEDPTNERPEKIKPILSLKDRKNIISSIKYVDKIIPYKNEKDLFNLLKKSKIDIRFLGDDYKNKNYTGYELNIPIKYISRNHKWSTTKLKKLIINESNCNRR